MRPSTTVADPVDLNLLLDWREPVTTRRFLRASVGSILVHVAVVVLVFSLPAVQPSHEAGPMIQPDLHKSVHIVAPRFFEPTQKEPNKGKITRELDVRSTHSAPQPQAPKYLPPTPPPGPVETAALEPPKIELPKIEAPKVETPKPDPPKADTPKPEPPKVVGTPPPAPGPPPEKPKLAFESIGSNMGHVTAPNDIVIPQPKTSIDSTVRNATPAPGAGGTMVGDMGDASTPVPSLSQTPSAGRVGSNLQLLSDAKGVDFKPYLVQVLIAVRRNWMAIFPEAARLGRRGRVLIQFSIDRNGGVPKLVIAEGAGTDALDRAAVAAVSASFPFPPLPAEYKGDQIRLQLAFAYNMPTR